MIYRPDDVTSWPSFKPRSLPMMSAAAATDRPRWSAATRPAGDACSGSTRPKNCRKACLDSARASALAAVDRRHHHNALIVADLSNDPTYAEMLVETFGPRVIGLQISRHGDGMNAEWRPVRTWSFAGLYGRQNLPDRAIPCRAAVGSGAFCRRTGDPPGL